MQASGSASTKANPSQPRVSIAATWSVAPCAPRLKRSTKSCTARSASRPLRAVPRLDPAAEELDRTLAAATATSHQRLRHHRLLLRHHLLTKAIDSALSPQLEPALHRPASPWIRIAPPRFRCDRRGI